MTLLGTTTDPTTMSCVYYCNTSDDQLGGWFGQFGDCGVFSYALGNDLVLATTNAADDVLLKVGGTTKLTVTNTEATFAGDVSVPTKTPASASATGTTGTITWDASYIYICTATDTWKRVAISTW